MVYLNGKNNLFYKCDHTHTEIGSPEAKLYSVDIPLRDGALDVTDQISDTVFYQDREILIELELRSVRGEWPMHVSHLMNDIHGKEIRVEFDDDPRYYWTGRAAVSMAEDHGATAGITITVTAKPYKRCNVRSTIYDQAIGTTDTLTFTTTAPRTYFRFDTHSLTSDATVTYDGETLTIPAGETTLYGLFVLPGTHTFDLTGTVTLTIETEEAML